MNGGRMLWRTARVVGIAVATLVVVVTLACLTLLGAFFFGWFALLLPLMAVILLVVALSERECARVGAEVCPQCGRQLSTPVMELVPPPDGGIPGLRAVYLCAGLQHSSWRWADTGEPLSPLDRHRPKRAQDVGSDVGEDS